MTGAALTVVAMLLLLAYLVGNRGYHKTEPSVSKQQQIDQPSRATVRQAQPPTTRSSLTLDLAAFSPSRGAAEDQSRKKVRLSRKMLRIRLLLPVGLEAGEYDVRLENSRGAIVIDQHARGLMTNGVTAVETDIDLSNANRGNFVLMIRPVGLEWRTFPALVE